MVLSFAHNFHDLSLGLSLLVQRQQLRVQVVLVFNLLIEVTELLLALFILLFELLFPDSLEPAFPLIDLILTRPLLLLSLRCISDVLLRLKSLLPQQLLEGLARIGIDFLSLRNSRIRIVSPLKHFVCIAQLESATSSALPKGR